MYHLAEFGPGHSAVIRSADGATIPDDPDNTDRQAYVEWVAAGNAPAEVAATLPQTIGPPQPGYRATSTTRRACAGMRMAWP